MYNKAYFISVHLLVYYMSENILVKYSYLNGFNIHL